MNGIDPFAHHRLDLVAIRADLRAARGDLARKKRALARSARPVGKAATDREREIEAVIDDDDDVARLEKLVQALESREDKAVADLEILARPQREHEWFVRERMADALGELATALVSINASLANGAANVLAPNLTDLIEDRSVRGESEYIAERAL